MCVSVCVRVVYFSLDFLVFYLSSVIRLVWI